MTVEHMLDINHQKRTEVQGLYTLGIKKSPKMIEVEGLVGDVVEFLEVSYVFFGMGPKRISEEVRRISQERLLLNPNGIKSWMEQFGIPQRSPKEAIRLSWQDPVIKARRKEGVRRFWQDPEKRQRRLSLIHSEEANKKRSEAMTLWCKDHSEQIRKIAEKARRTRKESKVLEMEKALGDKPAQALRRMHWEERLSVKQIAEQTKQDPSTLIRWMKDAGVMLRKKKGIGYVNQQDREIFEKALSSGLIVQLNERNRHILEERFLTKLTPTLEEVGQRYGIKKQRVMQLEHRALRSLEGLLNPQQSMKDVRIIIPTEELMVKQLNLLGLTNRLRNALAGGIRRGLISFHNPADLKDIPDEKLLKIRNLGSRSIAELKEKLQQLIGNST